MSSNKKDDDSCMLGCGFILVIGVIAMPLVGIYMLIKGEEEQKIIGILLTIIGTILWWYFFWRT